MLSNVIARRCFSTSSRIHAGVKWRLKNGHGKCGNEYGPLTDLSDWSFADSKQAPLTGNRLRRFERNKSIAETARLYMDDLKQAKENCAKKIALDSPIARPKIYPITSSQEEKRDI